MLSDASATCVMSCVLQVAGRYRCSPLSSMSSALHEYKNWQQTDGSQDSWTTMLQDSHVEIGKNQQRIHRPSAASLQACA